MATQQKEMLTRREAAEYLGMKPQTLAKWAVTGAHLTLIKVGNYAVRYRRRDLDAFIERQTVKST